MTKIFRTAAVLVLALLTLGLCGCANYIDLADRAIVQAIGIDYLPDKKHTVSVCSISISQARADKIR